MAVVSTMSIWAKPIDEAQANKLARQFVGRTKSEAKAIRPKDFELKHQKMEFAKDFIHVFNIGQNEGYIIVAADDMVEQPVLGYSDRGALTEEGMPENMRFWLSTYIDQIKWMTKHPTNGSMPGPRMAKAKSNTRAGNAIVEPLLGDIAWGQSNPYNLMTPMVDGRNRLTGCVATAAAQIMYYHRWPERGSGFKTYFDPGSGQEVSADFGSHRYEWDKMTPVYDSNSSEASRNAVALLMADLGTAFEMNYALGVSTTYTRIAATSMPEYFGYDDRIYGVDRREYTSDAWEEMMRRELNAQRPMIYSGSAVDTPVGHAFVCDGYDDEGYYHFNWGWEGSFNGWFLLTTMNPDNSSGYVIEHEMVCNIARPGQADERPVVGGVGTCVFDQASGVLTVTCNGQMSDLDSSEDYPWYEYKDKVKSVVFEPGVTSIGNFAFQFYPNLKNVALPEGVEIIGFSAFSGCPIEEIKMPDSMVLICGSAFSETKLKSVTFGPNISQIGNAFARTPSLKNFYVDKAHPSMTSVDGVLYDKGMTKLLYLPLGRESLNLPESVSRLGDFSMAGSMLKEVVLPNGIKEIGIYAFDQCIELKSVTLPRSLGKLNEGIFNSCIALEKVNIGPNVRELGSSAFSGCNSLKELVLPASLTYINPWAINYCINLRTITCHAEVAPGLADWAIQILNDGVKSTLRVPKGADYSSWLAQLGSNWEVEYFVPVPSTENVVEKSSEWVGYAYSGYPCSTDIDKYGYNNPHKVDVAIWVSNESNTVGRGLGVEGRKISSVGIMGARTSPTKGKAWISTKLPEKAEDADICVMDIDCSLLRRFEYAEFNLPQPVIVPKGGCYIGFSFESVGYETPFHIDQLWVSGPTIDNSCFMRSDGMVYNTWTDMHHLYKATVKYKLERDYYDNDAVPVYAMRSSAHVGKPSRTKISIASLGLSPTLGTVGVSVYEAVSRKWSNPVEYKMGYAPLIGGTVMVDIDLPASTKAGNLVDSLRVVTVNGRANPSAHIAIPVYLCNVDKPVAQRVMVSNYISKKFGDSMIGYVSKDLLEKEFGDNVIVKTCLKEDPVVPDFYSQYVFEESTALINEHSFQYYRPYFGLDEKGHGMAEEVKKVGANPATISIEPNAVWTDSGNSIHISTKLTTLADTDPKNLSISYYILADSLHGTGSDWSQLNSYAGTKTDDPNLAPLTKMPGQIDGLFYNNVSMTYNTFINSYNDLSPDDEKFLPAMKAGETLTREYEFFGGWYDFITDPEKYGLEFKNLKVVVSVYDNIKASIVNSNVCNIEQKPLSIELPSLDESQSGIGDIFNAQGVRMKDDVRNLPAGMYIIGGKKVMVK